MLDDSHLQPVTPEERRILAALPSTLVARVGYPRQPEIIRPAAADSMRKLWGDCFRSVSLEEIPFADGEDDGPQGGRTSDVFWRMSEDGKELDCRIALGAERLSVEARRPQDRSVLPDRFGSVVSRVQEQFRPECCTRVGLRYSCAIGMPRAKGLIRPEFIGMPRLERQASDLMGLAGLATSARAEFRRIDGLVVRAWWGRQAEDAPEGGSAAGGIWRTDLSFSQESVKPFEAGELREVAEGLVSRLIRMLGCMATDSLREDLGAQVTIPVGPGIDSGDDGPEDVPGRLKEELTTGQAVFEIKLLSGLSSSELAELFGVSRQSIHNWDCEGRMSRKNEDLLFRVLAAVRHLYQDGNVMTYQLLTEVDEVTGKTRFDLLKERRFDEAVAGVEDRDNLPDHSETRDEPEIHIPIDVQLGGSISDSTQFPGDVRPLEERSEAELRRINQLHPKSE